MRMVVRGTGKDGESIALELDLPSTLKVGDTFKFGAEGEEEEVEVIGMEREQGPDGAWVTTVTVGPAAVYMRMDDL